MDGEKDVPSASKNLRLGVLLAAAGILAIIAFSISAGVAAWLSVLAVATAIALGAMVVGLFVGFLFGIPRTAVSANSITTTAVATGLAGQSSAAPTVPDHQVNTNLQEISDWLTKIIVGVSLVEFGNLIGKLDEFGTRFADAFPTLPAAAVFIVAVVVLYFMIGLLFGFLWIRLELQLVIGLSDRFLLGKLRAKLIQENADTKLMELIRDLMDTAKAPPGAGVIAGAILAASDDALRLAFYRVREFRRNCTSAGSLSILNRLIPVLEGLIAADKAQYGGDGRYHRNYAQLAYIYKDRPEHSYDKAIELLCTAIKLRDAFAKDEIAYYRTYEFNRAISRIKFDPDFVQNRKADPALAAMVVADLQFALADATLQKSVNTDSETIAWLVLNDLQVVDGKISKKA